MGAGASIEPNLQSNPVVGIPQFGVKLSFAQEFIDACGGTDALSQFTTNDVCEKFVKPMTSQYRVSYCDYLKALNHPSVGKAEVFISHAWKYNFLDVITALQHHFVNKPDIIIWFDLFSNNQHKALNYEFDWWCNTFKSSIADIGYVVMVLSPWNNPIPFTRAWCLFELYCCIDTNSRFEIAMPPEQQNCFLHDINNNQVSEAVNRMYALIDCEHSDSFFRTDKDKIFEVVEKKVGFTKINSLVFERMRHWVIHTAQADYEQKVISLGEKHIHTLSALDQLGTLHLDQANYEQAKAYLTQCLHGREEVLGKTHRNTIATLNDLSKVYLSVQDFAQAEMMFQDCIKRLTSIHSEASTVVDADMIIMTKNNLAILYKNQQKYEQAIPLLEDCYTRKMKILNPTTDMTVFTSKAASSMHKLVVDPEVLDIMNNLGITYYSVQNTERATFFLEYAYQESIQFYQEIHPKTINTSINLANVYLQAKQFPAAKELLEKAYQFNVTKLGTLHHATYVALTSLVNVYNQLGEFTKAEQFLLTNLQSRKYEDPTIVQESTTWKLLFLLGNTYLNQQKGPACEHAFRACYEAQCKNVGELHPDTLDTMNNLGILYLNLRQCEKANELLSKCVAYKTHVYGEDHPSTIGTKSMYLRIPVEFQHPYTKPLPTLPSELKEHHEKEHGKKKGTATTHGKKNTSDTPHGTNKNTKKK